jgi:O-succinylbenzoic acid--CoA ligase
LPKTKVIAAGDTFGALVATGQALAGEITLFIAADAKDDLTPKAHGLADEYDDVALIVETSGSTAAPKRVALSISALLAAAEASARRLGGSGQWLLALPTNFVAGAMVLVRSVLADTQPVLLNTAVGFTPEGFTNYARLMTGAHRFTSLVPAQLVRLANAVDEHPTVLHALKSFDAILVGGQASDDRTLRQLRLHGVNLVTTYGSTETAGGVVYDGLPLEGVNLRIRNDLIEISSPTLASGCLSGGDASAFAVDGNQRWYRTTDLGALKEGRLQVFGRADRVFISGGVKTSLDEIEAVAAAIGGVVEVAAVAVRDAEWGERAAVIYLGSPEVADELAGRVLARLGPAATPIRVVRVDEIPRLSNGKPDYLGIKAFLENA